MKTLMQELKRYLEEALGVSVEPEKWQEANNLPFFLRENYTFFEMCLLNTPCLLMVARSDTEQPSATLQKHLLQVEGNRACPVIYVQQTISAYYRKRLIEDRIPFIVPGNQMYLPMLGIDLREYFRKLPKKRTQFSPSTQAVVLWILLHEITQAYTPSDLANILGYAPMTLSRVFDELESAGLGEVTMESRERVLRFTETKEELWKKARKFLRNPVKSRTWIQPLWFDWDVVQAGLTALAHYSLLAPPPRPVYAISSDDWKRMKEHGDIEELPIAEPDSWELEIWRYSPQLLAKDNVADRFSLYLSLHNEKDERVKSALEEMMGSIKW